ncbi:hypothetical protein OV090_21475 [Nannocystis sp. RBIL2]|uniref:hypothetical protein n=1 Tax=Nannocystis sp. RBIL2 TaxID=2996788 RepID=UPI0022711B58|nr:hypothetical protein [Nannocystis sp. RBIL2]MCY1067332.1 hypothetical protein [Nannocystis sp. RBIL2]
MTPAVRYRPARACGLLLIASACAGGSPIGDTTANSSTSTTSTTTTTTTASATTSAAPTTSSSTSTTSDTSTSEATSTTEVATTAITTGPGECAPVTSETFTLAQDVLLACGAMAAVDVFDVPLRHRGPAVARATLTIEHTQSVPEIHFWNATVLVGESQYGFGIGDDLCSGYQPVTRQNLGYGVLTEASDRVKVPMYQGSAPCTDGALAVRTGSTLTVWYADPTPGCERVAYTSWYATQGFEATYVWQTMMSPILALAIDTPPGTQALLMSVVEGSPDKNPNAVCGAETQTLVSQLRDGGAVLHQAEMLLPASGGQGHLVLANEALLPGAGPHAVDLAVGANVFDSAVRTGGCCGDAALFAVFVPE